MLKQDLDNLLALHEEWLQTEGESGKQAFLENVDLGPAKLANVDLTYSLLAGSNLNRADLTGTVLVNADLRGATLRYATLVGADLSHSNLAKAKLEGANLTNATLVNSYLKESSFDDACLFRANLRDALAPSASFVRANLVRAVLDGANFRSARLGQANLTNASLKVTSLHGANLSGAKVVGVDLSSADTEAVRASEGLLRVSQIEPEEWEENLLQRRWRIRMLQHVLLVSGWTIVGVSVLCLMVTIVAGSWDLFSIIQRAESVSKTSFPYLPSIMVTVTSAVLGNLMLYFRLHLDSVTLPVGDEDEGRSSEAMSDPSTQ